jgi:hypothetical protein
MKVNKLLFVILTIVFAALMVTACAPAPAPVVLTATTMTPDPSVSVQTNYYVEVICGSGMGNTTDFYSLYEPECDLSNGLLCKIPGPSFTSSRFTSGSYVVVSDINLVTTGGFCALSYYKQNETWTPGSPEEGNTFRIDESLISQFKALSGEDK